MMKNHPRISVIIPTYNRFPLVCEAIDSVLAQTFSDYELIVVDDGSTDQTPDVQKIYEGKLRFVSQENQGASAARNRGVVEARGKWVSFLDSDDLWLPDKLKIQKAAMDREPPVLISYTEEIWYRRGIRVNPMKKHSKYSGWIFEKSLPLCIISPSSVMIQKELFEKVGGFDEAFPVCEDYDLWLRMTKDYPVLLIERPLIVKRNGHPGQLSASRWGFDRYRVKAIAKILKNNDLSEKQAHVAREILKKKCRILSRGYYKRGDEKMGLYYDELSTV